MCLEVQNKKLLFWTRVRGRTPLTVFHTWHCRFEGVSLDSGCGHEKSHLMHDTEGLHYLYGIWFDILCTPFHVHLGRE